MSCVLPGCLEQVDLLPPHTDHLVLGAAAVTGVLSTLKWQALENGCISFVVVFSIDSWDLGEKKTNFYFLDYKFVLGIVAFV